VADSTQWLQDSSGVGVYISTKTVTDVAATFAQLQNAMKPYADVDAELLIIESDYANAFWRGVTTRITFA
jgi:hypothetical protein